MKKYLPAIALSFLVLILIVTPASADETDMNIPAGNNEFQVADAGFNVQLPSDFFGPGSEPFEGTIVCGGESDNSVDTTIKRLGDIILPPPPSEDTIPIEIVELNLVSCQPITVNNNDGSQQQWSVNVGLTPTAPPSGQMTIRRTHESGGTFDSELPVQPRFIFTRTSGNSQDEEMKFIDDLITPVPIGIVIIEDIVIDAFEAFDIPWVRCPEIDSDFCPKLLIYSAENGWLNLEPVVPALPGEDSCPFSAAPVNPIQYDINGDGVVDDRDVNSLRYLVAVDDLQPLMDFSRVFFDETGGKALYSYGYSEGELTSISVFEYKIDDPATDQDESSVIESVQQHDLTKADINKDGVVDEVDTKLLEESLKNLNLIDIDGDGVSDERDVSALQLLIDTLAGADSPEKEFTSGDLARADINKDGLINEEDVELLALALKSVRDINGDGVIDERDTQRIQEPMCPDADNDGVIDSIDNCPLTANPDQSDLDTDSLGDVCDNCPNDPDNDADSDGMCGDVDNCPLENPRGLDADSDGCTDTIEGLYDNLQSTEIQAGVKNSLLAKVSSALSSLTTGKLQAAINQLNAFINQVEAQSGKKIPQQDADILVGFAQNIVQAREHELAITNTWPRDHSTTVSPTWPQNHYGWVSPTWPENHNRRISPTWPSYHRSNPSSNWPANHRGEFSPTWPDDHPGAISVTWPADHTRWRSHSWPAGHSARVSPTYPRDHDYRPSSQWPPDHPYWRTQGWPGDHNYDNSPSWPEDHPYWVSRTWPGDHSVEVSPTYPRPPEHFTWPSHDWPPDHSYSISPTWPTDHLYIIGSQGWPTDHSPEVSPTWPADHRRWPSRTWKPDHPIRISQSWPPFHSFDNSPTWPEDHSIEISPNWPANHLIEVSPTWPPEHPIWVSRTWPKEHSVEVSPTWPKGHYYESTSSWPQDHPVPFSQSWPREHPAEISVTWPSDHTVWGSPNWPSNHDIKESPTWPVLCPSSPCPGGGIIEKMTTARG